MCVCNSHMKVIRRILIHTLTILYYTYMNLMDKKEISNFIRDCNIGVDNQCLSQALQFLERHVGKLTPGEEQYEALAATAIAGETGLIRDVTLTHRVRSGITLEHVMRHIGKLSKEEYIKVVKRQVSKWRQAPDWLNIKVTNLNICYRIYKKYRSVFNDLAKDTVFSMEPTAFNLMAIFWIVFLYIKNQDPLFESTAEQVTLLHCIFLFTFSEISVKIERGRVNNAFLKYFPEGKMPTLERYESLKGRIMEGLGKVHTYRQRQGFFQPAELASDYVSTRFLDDLSNLYERFKARLPQNNINEISFLEIEKNLTPQSIKVPNFGSSAMISRVLDLSKDDDDFDFEPEGGIGEQRKWETMFENLKQVEKESNFKRMPVSPFRSLPKHDLMTPVSASHTNNNWLREIVSRIEKFEVEQLQKTYEKFAKKQFEAYKEEVLERITLTIQFITPECADFTKRQYEIYNFYIHLVNRIAENHTPFEKSTIFADDLAFNALLCLAFDIFNFANQSLSSCFRKNCQLFGISLLQGHSAIAHLDPPIDMPRTIKDYIYSLEKRILIDELWQDDSGYSLLSGGVDNFSRKRLDKFVAERAQDLCGRMGIQEKEVARVINLVRYILSKRAILLKNYRVDQIIVCSIASILNINRSQSRFTLQEVFQHYNQLILSFYSNRDSLYDFYNNIFLSALEDVVNDQHSAILNTPVRLERQRNRQLGIESTPLAKKLFQPPNFSLLKRFEKEYQSIPEGEEGEQEEGRPRKISYKSTLALQSINSMKSLQKREEQSVSPTFGGASEPPVMIDRLFSFGDIDQ